MQRYRYIMLLACLLVIDAAWAKDEKKPVVTAPPPPETLKPQAEGVEPRVSIVRRGWATIEEYSVAGQVYAVKITPTVGVAYYLYDSDGDGSLETRRDVNPEMPELNRWRILTW
jgi:hypothetical protein